MTLLLGIYLRVKFLGYGVCAVLVGAESLQSCPTPCDSMGYRPPGSSVHGTLKARVLDWFAMPFSRGNCSGGGELPGKVLERIAEINLHTEWDLFDD